LETKIASNGEETLSLAAHWIPDLVLLDVMMPKMSGFEVCKRLRADPATKDTSVLMVTALDQPADVDKAVDAGTDDFVTKPLAKAELVLRVKAMLAARAQSTAVDRTLTYIRGVQDGV
jgi:DNA-binding response OmpR family regulator